MPKSQAELLALTPEQKKAFAQLKRAFTACAKAGLYIWDDYGRVAAVNGKGIDCLVADSSCGELADRDNFEVFKPKRWGSANSDDPLYIQLR